MLLILNRRVTVMQLYMRIGRLLLLSLLLSSLSMAHARPAVQADPFRSDDTLIAQLDQATAGHVRISYHAETGKVRFIGADQQDAIPHPASLAASANPEQAARAFLSSYGSLFGLTDSSRELTVMRAPA